MELDGGQEYYLKPMNCPFHILIYKSRQRSYRELPLRLFEFGTVYRYEKSGVVHGLTRARGFTQDDAHIFCTRDQMADELHTTLTFVLSLLRDFGLEDFYLELSTQPEGKARGHRRGVGRGHRGPADRPPWPWTWTSSWTRGAVPSTAPRSPSRPRTPSAAPTRCRPSSSTSMLPQRFGIEYIGADNARHRPIMIHRALFGSVERFFAILLEHYAGALPTWLSPEQVRVLGVRDDHEAYAHKVADRLRAVGARVSVDPADEPLGARIRRAKLLKIPYILVVGDDDVHAGTVGVNRRGSQHSRPRGRARPTSPPTGAGDRRASAARGTGEPRAPVGRMAHGLRDVAASGRRAPRGPDDGHGEQSCVFCRIAASGPPSAENGVLWVGDRTPSPC